MKPRVAILVPTVGRPSLRRSLESIRASWDGERIVVLAQRDIAAAEAIFDDVDPRIWIDGKPSWTFHALADTEGGYGHDSRNFALDHLVTDCTHVGTCDDDDELTPEALDAFAAAAFSDAPVTIFKTTWGVGSHASGVTLWNTAGRVAYGEIATPMIFHRVGRSRWGMGYEGDYLMAESLAAEFDPASWDWRDEVVCIVRPDVADLAT